MQVFVGRVRGGRPPDLHAPCHVSHGLPYRFSSDVSVVDDSLPFILNIALANAVSLLGLLAVMAASAPPLLPLLLPLGLLYRWGYS